MINTEAWVLHQGTSKDSRPAELQRETFSFPDITEEEVLAEPIYGCWEANMTHALKRHPVDVCRLRRERQVVLGNAGVARVLKVGKSVTSLKEGDICTLIPIGQLDQYGYMIKVFGYDSPNTVGMLAKLTKLNEKQLTPIPENTKHSLKQWAAYSVRYATAWDNWKVAYACFRSQIAEEEQPAPFVCGWGGGVALAELALAKFYGCKVAMISSKEERLKLIGQMGISPIDRRQFADLHFDEQRYESDHKYRAHYLQMERQFLDVIREHTGNQGVSIFIDNIGTPVIRATLKALARQGLITTTGWDRGYRTLFSRIGECTNRHIHVHTHGGRYPQIIESVHFAEREGWMAPIEDEPYGWENIPQLAKDFAEGKIVSYFPIFEVNPQ
ncbi:MAG: zinc-binding alcohol dehydrogenase family protein [Pyrinomonadaceae bacterium]